MTIEQAEVVLSPEEEQIVLQARAQSEGEPIKSWEQVRSELEHSER